MEDSDLPTKADLELLAEKLPELVSNSDQYTWHKETYIQWSSLFQKVGNAPDCQEQLKSLLNIMADWLKGLPEGLSPCTASTLLNNLQAMPSAVSTEAVLQAMARYISQEPFLSDQSITYALFVLQNMPQMDGTDAVLQAIAWRISESTTFSACDILEALGNMRNMPQIPGTEAVLRAIAGQISLARSFSGQDVVCVLSELQNMPQSAGTQAVLQAMARHISNTRSLPVQTIVYVLSGLQNMPQTADTESLLKAIASHIAKAPPFICPRNGQCPVWAAKHAADGRHSRGAECLG
ncbi:hypothetical protein EO087_08750 [Dyella sp. M7H15-1]|uniref:hypothetical protein n=1 Tax=Dyella sp. M7H15-1 TaxID=2501295 RepID=UPI001004F73C|nr:hypothetical protein [Dyella sp. M7H15-1]QAU24068.1 hypothetical protein EO087_08750 [Dyella sp. M7H15-1]